MAIEAEIKCQIMNMKLLEGYIKGLERSPPKRTVDVYFDTKDRNLLKRSIYLRIRDRKTLDFKFNFNDPKHEYVNESSFKLPLNEKDLDAFTKLTKVLKMKVPIKGSFTFESFKEENNLEEFMTIDKTRSLVEMPQLKIYLDEVKELGSFVELEKYVDNNYEVEDAVKELNMLAEKLQMKVLPVGYVELYLRKFDYQMYLQGPYLLPEDRKATA